MELLWVMMVRWSAVRKAGESKPRLLSCPLMLELMLIALLMLMPMLGFVALLCFFGVDVKPSLIPAEVGQSRAGL